MKITRRTFWWLGGTLLVLLAFGVIVRTWVVPVVIVRVIQSHYDGRVAIRDWWLNGTSTGVRGLALHEGSAGDSPVWATAESVTTDLTLGGLLRGRFSPGKLTLRAPRLTFRLDRDGKPLTRVPVKPSHGAGLLPNVVVQDARVTLIQEGRPHPMKVAGLNARLDSRPSTIELSAVAHDPTWGTWEARGLLSASNWAGTVSVNGRHLDADPDKLRRLPYVPLDVWSHVAPRGPLEVKATFRIAPLEARPVHVQTEVNLDRTTLALPTLGIATTETRGRLLVQNSIVRLDQITGRALGGRVVVGGTLDFTRSPSRFNLTLDLDRVNVAQTPQFWRLGELGITGRLTGEANLRAAVARTDVDLSGTTGHAVVEGGTIQGIPVKRLQLKMHAEGENLEYETGESAAARIGLLAPLLIGLQGFPGTHRAKPAQAPAAQAPAAQAPAAHEPEPKGGGSGFAFKLPQAVSTEIELEDVDLRTILSRVEALGIELPFEVEGRLTLKCRATIPLGKLRELKRYRFQGRMSLAGASIAGVDLGRLDAELNLKDGVLKLSEFSGHLVDMPDGGLRHPPKATPSVPMSGPLPASAFRGTLRAELSPPGRLTINLEGNRLPLGELVAPEFPRPTPVAGKVSVDLRVEGDVKRLDDVKRWKAAGTIDSERVTYRDTVLDSLKTSLKVDDGHLTIPTLAARLAGQPLDAHGSLELSTPYAFDLAVDVMRWPLAKALAFVPAAHSSLPIDGALTAHVQAAGALSPWSISSSGGNGQVAGLRVERIPLGDVPFRWSMGENAIEVTGVDAHPFGGRVTLTGRVPTAAGHAITGALTIEHIQTEQLASVLPAGHPSLAGTADGRVDFLVRPTASGLPATVEANVELHSEELKVDGIAAKAVQAVVTLRGSRLAYDFYAEPLGGKVEVKGALPFGNGSRGEAEGRAQAVGLQLGELWGPLKVTSALSKLSGVVAVDAAVLADAGLKDLRARGVAEVRSLRWTDELPLGGLKGTFVRTATGWRLDPVNGMLLGSAARGSIWGETPRGQPSHIGFGFDIDRVPLKKVLAAVPELAGSLSGAASLHVAGRFDETLQVDAEAAADRGQLFGLPVTELRVPASLTYHPNAGFGNIKVQRMTARVAGGHLRGEAHYRFGSEPEFNTAFDLREINLETLARRFTDSRRPASGRITGRVTLNGRELSDLRRYHGTIRLDLDDGSIGDLPVFRQLDKFLGSASGGVFEDGDMLAVIRNRQIEVEELTLVGRLAQLHARGTVGLDGTLNLVVLVNTSQIISETGQALVSLIPGLGDAIGRREEAVSRVSGFLSTRLLKLRVTGTIRNPQVNADPAIIVTEAAVGFFGGILKLPLNLLR